MYSHAKWGISNEPIRNPFLKKPKFNLLTILPIFPSSQMKVLRVSQENLPRSKHEINLCLETLLRLPLNLSSYYSVPYKENHMCFSQLMTLWHQNALIVDLKKSAKYFSSKMCLFRNSRIVMEQATTAGQMQVHWNEGNSFVERKRSLGGLL